MTALEPDLTPSASPPEAPAALAGPRPIEIALLISVFVVAACGLLYELAAGALASYVLGDSVLQFSTIIGTYLFAMGVGSWLSRYFERQLPAHFLRIELLVALSQLGLFRHQLGFVLAPLDTHEALVLGQLLLAGGGFTNALVLGFQAGFGGLELGGVDALFSQLLAEGLFQLGALALVFGVGIAELLFVGA